MIAPTRARQTHCIIMMCQDKIRAFAKQKALLIMQGLLLCPNISSKSITNAVANDCGMIVCITVVNVIANGSANEKKEIVFVPNCA